MSSPRKLFTPLKVGKMDLKHRIVMAPLTRFRADENSVPTDLVVEYYKQRASVPGTLIISEATLITERAGSHTHVPGIYTQAQIDGWKKVTDAIHAQGSYIYLQLWALGRTGSPDELKKRGHDVVSASDIPYEPQAATPRPLTEDEIREYVQDFATAAKNAVEAGFDGVEVHNANGYLPDQFLQDVSNKRTDKYGGSIENRSRFSLEIIEAVTSEIGAERTAIRLSPFSEYQGMRMADPIPQFTNLITSLATKYPNLAYLHLVEARINGGSDTLSSESLDFAQDLWKDKVFFRAGGYKPESAKDTVEKYEGDVAIVIGRYFISNPDLVRRVEEGIELTAYDRDLFYNKTEARGYTDYSFAKEIKARA